MKADQNDNGNLVTMNFKRDMTPLLSPSETSSILGVTVGTLSVWRATKRQNLPYVKCGRSVKYRKEDVESYINRQYITIC